MANADFRAARLAQLWRQRRTRPRKRSRLLTCCDVRRAQVTSSPWCCAFCLSNHTDGTRYPVVTAALATHLSRPELGKRKDTANCGRDGAQRAGATRGDTAERRLDHHNMKVRCDPPAPVTATGSTGSTGSPCGGPYAHEMYTIGVFVPADPHHVDLVRCTRPHPIVLVELTRRVTPCPKPAAWKSALTTQRARCQSPKSSAPMSEVLCTGTSHGLPGVPNADRPARQLSGASGRVTPVLGESPVLGTCPKKLISPSAVWPCPVHRLDTRSPSTIGTTSSVKVSAVNIFRVCSMIDASSAGPPTSRWGQWPTTSFETSSGAPDGP